jgi:hypothetical protein
MLLVERSRPGLYVGQEERKLGLRGSSTVPLHFEDVRLPLCQVIGAPGNGLTQLAQVLAYGRTLMASGCAGLARAAIERTLAHVTSRSQFGRKLASFEIVREQVAEMAALHFMMLAVTRRACGAVDDPDVGLRRSLAAKVLCSEAVWRICDTTVQLHGGSGTMEGTGIPLLLRDARVMRIFEGANDVLIQRAGLTEALAHRERTALSGRAPAWASEAARAADRFDQALARLRDRLVRELGARLLRKQGELGRLGRLAILCEATDATVLRALAVGDARSMSLALHWVHWAKAQTRAALDAPCSRDVLVRLTDDLYGERLS